MANTKVTTGVIKDDAVGADQLASNSVVTASIVDNAITTAKINNDAILTAKISNSAVTNAKLSANSVDSDQYVDGSIDTAHIADGQITSAKLDTNISVSGELTVGSHLNMGDNDILKMGAGADLQIYHDGSNSYVKDAGTGNLNLQGENLALENTSGDNYFVGVNGSFAKIYYSGVEKLATTSSGIDVTGTATMDGLTVEGTATTRPTIGNSDVNTSGLTTGLNFKPISNIGDGAKLNVISGLQPTTPSPYTAGFEFVTHDWNGTTNTQTKALTIGASGDISFYEDTGTTAKLFWDASAERLGIGLTSPSAPLHVGGEAYFNAGTRHYTYDDQANYWSLYTNTDDSFRFNYNGAGEDEIVINTSGNVGIGTTSPSSVLHLSTSNDPKITLTDTGFGASADITGSNGNLRLNSQTATIFDMADSEIARFDSSGRFGIGCTPTSFATEIQATSGGNALKLRGRSAAENAGWLVWTDNADNVEAAMYATANNLIFANTTSYTERMRIDSSGNVLINSSSVKNLGFTTNFQIEGTGATSASQAIIRNSDSIDPPYFIFGKSRGTSNGSNTIVQDNDILGRIRWMGADGSDMASAAAEINCFVDGTPGSNDMPGALTFSTTSDGAASTTERMRINSSGKILMNTTTQSDTVVLTLGGVSSAKNGLAIVNSVDTGTIYSIYFRAASGSLIGSITNNGSNVTYNTSSDARLKDITGEARGLEVINALNPVSYNWKESGQADEGLIAQEVKEIVPNAVTGSEEEMYQMDYSKLVVHLVAGMKEQQAQIETLKQEIQKLKE